MKMLKMMCLGMAFGAALCLISCGEAPKSGPAAGEELPPSVETSAEPAAGSVVRTNERIFLVRGEVKEVLPERSRIRIAHERIPDYMEAMTMLFKVKDGKDLKQFSPGDTVRFRMVVTADDGWIDNLVKEEPASAAVAPSISTFRRVREVEPLNEGDTMPEYHFTNELGQAVSLSDYRGKSVGLTFLFTRCAFPTFCPRMAGNFAAAQEKLQALENGPRNWQLLTITFDPEYDTPEVLRSYAKGFGYDTNHWSFLTGELIDITAIAEQFGLLFWRSDPTKPAGIDHNLRTVVIDANGRVQKILAENEWKVDELVAEIVKGANPPPASE